MARKVAVIGGDAGAAQAALSLAEMGVEVSLITSATSLGLDSSVPSASSQDMLHIWPLLLRAASHPLVSLHTNSQVEEIKGKRGKFTIRVVRQPRYVREDLCTSCGRCSEACSVKIRSLLEGQKTVHSAIHAPFLNAKAIPSAYYIEKNGVAPCRAACPLGIKVQGFISLLSRGKVDEALSLINEAAPLAGILGRVCTHACESSCKRAEVDDPVFIQAMHRYAADNASGIKYSRKASAASRKEKVAIVGSGPAGLTAAWELARRGYTPAIFESHAVAGGMLATGIPRFRLPREVREREVEAIRAIGVDIKTGITVGRDVTLADLKARQYKAFFIAIGSQKNNRLDIPGEDLDGVVDGISLLFALNQKVGVSVGSNIVVIGGGNSAVDSARTAKRGGRGKVRILYRRTADAITAVKEDIEEAIKEGITIEYLTSPVEIIGDGNKVTGIRCQRMRLGDMGEDGRRRPEPITGSEFVIDTDQVVVAIGQRPDTSLLNIKGLNTVGDDGTIKVDPLTLETNMPGVFAGGDCIMGPNNVVEAMAAGLRAAESIDRYLRGHDLRKGRTIGKPRVAQVDIREREPSRHKRAHMPLIHYSKRMGSFEETSSGLPRDAAEQEARRCLNCALCSECLECEEACELGAVFHKDSIKNIEIEAEAIINFTHDDRGKTTVRKSTRPGIYTVKTRDNGNLGNKLARASAIAMEAAAELKLREEVYPAEPDTTGEPDAQSEPQSLEATPGSSNRGRIGLVLCSCGGSISSVIDFEQVLREIELLPNIYSVQEIAQACSEEGAQQIAAKAAESKLGQVVLAACRCCNLDQICYSCTDRRVRCQHYLNDGLISSCGIPVEFVNIREQCAWVHKDDPTGATRKAIEIITAGVTRAKGTIASTIEERRLESSILILGAGLSGLAAASALLSQGYSVALVSGPGPEKATKKHSKYLDTKSSLEKQLEEQSVHIMSCPQKLGLEGLAGDFEAILKYPTQTNHIKAGAMILDPGEMDAKTLTAGDAIPKDSLLSHILTRDKHPKNTADTDSALFRGFSIKETAGIFLVSSDKAESPEEQVIKGTAAAARAAAYLAQGILSPRATAITIDSKLCRGCGDCAAICPYIEMRVESSGPACAHVDQALCLGCGACIARCPTGAISQPVQSDKQIMSMLEALLGTTYSASSVT
jgi:NADPH-dependent glutamate synthase beta subunit-like oxidoreductase/formate hydrogenlyase subunit 6/NADH:ubiquinone oxidoreductase subunit I